MIAGTLVGTMRAGLRRRVATLNIQGKHVKLMLNAVALFRHIFTIFTFRSCPLLLDV
jgi:hypothetical protein